MRLAVQLRGSLGVDPGKERRLRKIVGFAAGVIACVEVLHIIAMGLNRPLLLRARQSVALWLLVGMLVAMLAYRLFRAVRQHRQQQCP